MEEILRAKRLEQGNIEVCKHAGNQGSRYLCF